MRKALAGAFLVAFLVPAMPASATTRNTTGNFGGPGTLVTASIAKLVFRHHGRRICRSASGSGMVM